MCFGFLHPVSFGRLKTDEFGRQKTAELRGWSRNQVLKIQMENPANQCLGQRRKQTAS